MRNETYMAEICLLLIDRRNKLVAYRQEYKNTWGRIRNDSRNAPSRNNLDAMEAQISQIDVSRWKEIRQIDRALVKYEQDRYGICEACENPIRLERLKAMPYARLCAQCEEKRSSMVRSAISMTERRDMRLNIAEG